MPNRRRWTAEQKRAILEEYDSTPWGRGCGVRTHQLTHTAIAVVLLQAEPGSEVRVFAADDDPHAGWPAEQVEHASDLGDVSAVADLTVGGERRRTRLVRQLADDLVSAACLVGKPTDLAQLSAPEPVVAGEQLMGGTGPVGADQQVSRDARRVAARWRGSTRRCGHLRGC
jgi:hypothetical protein